MVKALVTGSTGFVGSNLVLALNQHGIEVRALQRKTSPQDAIKGLDYEPVVGGFDGDRIAGCGCGWSRLGVSCGGDFGLAQHSRRDGLSGQCGRCAVI